jgi:hypothetical protein
MVVDKVHNDDDCHRNLHETVIIGRTGAFFSRL